MGDEDFFANKIVFDLMWDAMFDNSKVVIEDVVEAVEANVTEVLEDPTQVALFKEKPGLGDVFNAFIVYFLIALFFFKAFTQRGGRAKVLPGTPHAYFELEQRSMDKASDKLSQMTTDNVVKMITVYASNNNEDFIKLINACMKQAVELEKTGLFEGTNPTVWMENPKAKELMFKAFNAAAAAAGMKGGKRKSKKSRKSRKSRKSKKSRKSRKSKKSRRRRR